MIALLLALALALVSNSRSADCAPGLRTVETPDGIACFLPDAVAPTLVYTAEEAI